MAQKSLILKSLQKENEKRGNQIVLSASRRTDIPAFYMDWFMAQLACGSIEIFHPYTRKSSVLDIRPERVHSIVFWSKNYASFLHNAYGEKIVAQGYPLFFNFTLNSRQTLLEPQLPALEFRLNQLEELSLKFGPENISWRFDPICFFRIGDGPVLNNLDDFQQIADRAVNAGITRCITSFMDPYAKVQSRIKRLSLSDFSFVDPSFDHKIEVLLDLEKILISRGISLSICCEKRLFESLPKNSGIEQSSCIPTPLLMSHFGGNPDLRIDRGQRKEKGCGCYISVDIGSYHLHPCMNRCLYCYANPTDYISHEDISKKEDSNEKRNPMCAQRNYPG